MRGEEILEVFGKRYSCIGYMHFSIAELKKSPLKEIFSELFELFIRLCEDHPDELNTVVYFIKKDEQVDMLWTCSHFEGTSVQEVTGLLYFMQELEFISESVHIDLLDGVAERLIIICYDIQKNIWDTLEKYLENS